MINYKLNSLDAGTYTLKVTAWDVFNNTSNATVNFNVINGSGLVIDDIYNYPDPFGSNTTFTFQQNLASPINVKIKVYTVAGRLIREIERYGITSKFVKVDWDGRDQNGDLIANGTYLYKVIVHSVDGQYSQSALGKLAKIR
jgi:flagellar hook assembly protein FlgD